MHKCLAVDDVFAIILDYAGGWDDFDLSTAGLLEVVDDYEFHSPFNTGPLYSLALTCQTFKEAALTRLWSRQRCLDNLLKLLPLDLLATPRESYFWVDFYPFPGDEWPFQKAPCEILVSLLYTLTICGSHSLVRTLSDHRLRGIGTASTTMLAVW